MRPRLSIAVSDFHVGKLPADPVSVEAMTDRLTRHTSVYSSRPGRRNAAAGTVTESFCSRILACQSIAPPTRVGGGVGNSRACHCSPVPHRFTDTRSVPPKRLVDYFPATAQQQLWAYRPTLFALWRPASSTLRPRASATTAEESYRRRKAAEIARPLCERASSAHRAHPTTTGPATEKSGVWAIL